MSEKFQPLDVAIPDEAGWKKKTLDELCSLISRGTAPVYVESSSFLAIGQRCVTSSQFAPEFARPHAERAMRNVLRPESGDVLLNSTGTGTIGRSVVFDHDGAFIVDGHVTVLRPKPEGTDGRWLNAVLRTSWGQRHLERFCYAGSTNQLELSRTPVKASMLPVPSLAEQHAIAQVLDTLDTTIRETEALIDKLKAVKQGLLHDLLTRGVDANGRLRPPQSEAPLLYKESQLGWIPREWECKEFSALAEYLNGNTFDAAAWTDSGFPIIRIQNLNGSRDFNYYAGAIQEKWHVHPGDLLFAWSGQRGMSFGARLWNGPEGVLNQHIFRVLPKESLVSKAFLYRLLRFRQVNIEDSAHGFKDSFLHVTRGELGRVNAGVPPLDEQERIELRIATYESKLLIEEAELDKLRSLKSGLMDDLLTGRVRVTPLLESMQRAAAQTGA